ncbi:hypothetical protein [Halarcobacter sp.]|uniref:hypothetical protein n=1 Tax=Halarcobacter sp. TaxID=2321133 RepID=UPI003A90765A
MGINITKETSGFASTTYIPYPPEKWDYILNSKDINIINPNQIISYNQHSGDICSLYKDDIWYLKHSINPRQHAVIHFEKIINKINREIAKRLIFNIIHFSKGKNRSIKAPTTIIQFYDKVIMPIINFLSIKNINLLDFLKNDDIIIKYIESSVEKNKSRSKLHKTFFLFLQKLPIEISGVNYSFNNKYIEILTIYDKEFVDNFKQSECIPPRILKNAQAMRWKHIDEIEKVLPKLLKLIERFMDEPYNYYNTRSNAVWKAKKEGIHYNYIGEIETPSNLFKKLGLTNFCKRYNIENRVTLKDFLVKLSRTSRHLIYGYTGMRNDEGNLLEINCYNKKGAGIHPIIVGLEKKNGIPKEHPFVTIKEIERVIKIQKLITTTIARYTHLDEKNLPLLFNPSWIVGNAKYLEASPKHPHMELPLDESKIILREEEMNNTLKATENRDWDNDKDFKVGKAWKFNWHQYRRSIAVYALNTGLVSLTALGKQFKHLFEATTAHYGNGHFIAEPLVGTDSKHHVKYEMDEQREQYEALAMYRDMMFNLERPKSNFAPEIIEENNEINPKLQISSAEEVNTLAKRIKNNETFYTNTAIGSCKSPYPCNGHMMLFFVGCVECTDSIVNDNKLNNTIHSVINFKKELEEHMPNSIELRDIEQDLVELNKLKDKRINNE